MRRCTGDAGNAIVEFVYLAVLLMVPLVYVLITVFQVQSAAFAVTEAARQAGRAYASAPSAAEGRAVAEAAAHLALADQGIADGRGIEVSAPDGVAPGATVTVTVAHEVALPILGGSSARCGLTSPSGPPTSKWSTASARRPARDHEATSAR